MLGLLGLLGCDGAPDVVKGRPDPADPDSGETDDTSRTDTDTGGTGPPDPCDEDAPDPGGPAASEVVSTLTVTIRTDDGTYGGTDDEALELCVSDTACFALSQGDHDGLESGAVGVWTFEGLAIPRADVTGVRLQTTDGDNQWTPACIDVRFDGEPVYCEDEPGVKIGDAGGDEVLSWEDPGGLHEDCVTCWDGPLTHGPMIGAVTPSTARIWVRTDATRRVQLRVAKDPSMADARTAAWAYPAAEDDFTAELTTECLDRGETWYYEVLVDGVSVMDEPLALPTPPERGDAAAFRLAFGSCAKDEDQPVFASILADAPDLFLFAGDNHYGNTTELGSLRWFYRWSLERPERAAMVARVPTVATWDDHDFLGNDTLGTDPAREEALRAFTEYWANPSYGTPEHPGVYTVVSWGEVDLFLLDDRYYRDVEGTMLGSAQHAWLLDAVAASDATFKLLVTGSEWSFEGGGESWLDYSEERDQLFGELADLGIPGVVLLSGDIHRSELRLIDRDGAYDLPELISSPLANTASICGDDDEQVACYADVSYLTVDIDPTLADPTLTAAIRDVEGTEVASWTITRSELE